MRRIILILLPVFLLSCGGKDEATIKAEEWMNANFIPAFNNAKIESAISAVCTFDAAAVSARQDELNKQIEQVAIEGATDGYPVDGTVSFSMVKQILIGSSIAAFQKILDSSSDYAEATISLSFDKKDSGRDSMTYVVVMKKEGLEVLNDLPFTVNK